MYLRHHGLHQFGPGSLCHDVLNAVAGYGLVPEFAYSGLDKGETEFNHGELDAVLAAAVKAMSSKRCCPTTGGMRWKASATLIWANCPRVSNSTAKRTH